jgi:hypothetical protein
MRKPGRRKPGISAPGLFSLATLAYAQAPELPGWKLVWADEFNYTGWSFDRPMCVIMNVACAGPDEPAPDDSKLPQFTTVDCVRAYRKIPTTGAGPE